MAMLNFEVAAAQIDSPPQVIVNGAGSRPGCVLTMPDLADPGYRGEVETDGRSRCVFITLAGCARRSLFRRLI